ncbi:3-deoxy-D-manno-octulosonic acid transferase [Amylibacter marinus]|uniref:3-deoxy-D-manno-octulosonic acid transferase n=2 Tax=Amylibacter marinus TaxID=1475483 RepID=A0ABQ5VTC9_9RHOB|nr:3-deoxy-D-manno-octulosonic acid transferase [Amylibacter marinus]
MAPVASRHLQKRLAKGKEDPDRLQEKLGFASHMRPQGRLIWMHAVGVGEVLALPALITRMSQLDPAAHFLITTSVRNAATALADNLPPRSVHQYLPLDCMPFVTRFLDHWKPDLSIWAERDIWPAMIHQCHRRAIPLAIVNGRMDQKSFASKARLKSLFRAVYARFDLISVQDTISHTNFETLTPKGTDIQITGSLKASAPALHLDKEKLHIWRRHLGDRPVWVAASTHPNEEMFCIEAHQEYRKFAPDAALIIAPRDPARAHHIAADTHLSNSLIQEALPSQSASIYIETEIGNMGLWYDLAAAGFIGGSIADIGGHNPYEPARLACAIIHGPNTYNFADDYARFHQAKAAIEITTPSALAQALLAPKHPTDTAQKLATTPHPELEGLARNLLALIAPE